MQLKMNNVAGSAGRAGRNAGRHFGRVNAARGRGRVYAQAVYAVRAPIDYSGSYGSWSDED